MNYDQLFEPGRIGSCQTKNRIIMAPMGNINMADPMGKPSTKMIDYFVERARGGTGLWLDFISTIYKNRCQQPRQAV